MQENQSLSERYPEIEWDYGDDIRDYEIKERKEWKKLMETTYPQYDQP